MERDRGVSLLDDGISWCGTHTQCDGRYIWETSLSNHMDGSDTNGLDYLVSEGYVDVYSRRTKRAYVNQRKTRSRLRGCEALNVHSH